MKKLKFTLIFSLGLLSYVASFSQSQTNSTNLLHTYGVDDGGARFGVDDGGARFGVDDGGARFGIGDGGARFGIDDGGSKFGIDDGGGRFVSIREAGE